MSGAPLLQVGAPLGLTYWVLVVATAVIVFLLGVLGARHLEWRRAARRRENVARELEPMFARFRATADRALLEEELRASMRRMDAAHRPVAAVLIIDLMREATSRAQADAVRQALVESGIVQLGEKGTRRLSPWRRALACELLGKIGAPRSVPALLVRLEDRRLEVRTAAARALGDIGSNEAVPALSEASCSAALRRRTSSPTRCGGSAARTPARRSSEASQVNWPYLVALPRQGPLLLARWGLVEALWFRPCLAWWRLKATVLALSGRRPGWGTIPRGAGILERPAEVVAPLTR